ncbi:MAG: AAA family ATPase [Desulfamplus sp.]|nr:AAA family ATPase [Desulfamplus sp.]
MKILRLYIRKCGVFKNTLIDFTRNNQHQNILCLAGVNGSGKTTIMELIFNIFNLLNPNLSLQNISFDRLKSNILARTDFAQLDISIDGKILSLVLGDSSNIQADIEHPELQGFIIEDEIKTMISHFENAVVKTPEDEERSAVINIKVSGIRESDRFSTRRIEKRNTDIFNSLLNSIDKSFYDKNTVQNDNGGLPFIYFFNAHDREILDIRYASIPKEQQEYQIAHRYHPKSYDLKKTLVYYDYAYQEKFKDIKDWVNKYIFIGKYIDKIDRPNFNVVIKTTDGREHGLELLSSGEESLLIIAIQLYLRASANSVFLIDEIDQSLHPEFQEKVIKLLFQLQKDKGCQIIVSSHSEIVWDFFKERGLIDLTEMVL